MVLHGGASLRSTALEAAPQSVAGGADGYAGHLHGGAGYLHRQRCAATYGGVAGRKSGGGNVGADQLSGVERHCSANLWVALQPIWTQALLHGLRDDVYGLLHAVRICAHTATADWCTHSARTGRRWTGTERAG